MQGENIKLHKIASNKQEVMEAFPQEDLAKDIKDLDLRKDFLPLQTSLGNGSSCHSRETSLERADPRHDQLGCTTTRARSGQMGSLEKFAIRAK